MLGREPSQPKLWKALLGAGIVTFPFLYLADVAITHRPPGWIYLVIATVITMLIGLQMYRKGPEGLRRIPIGASLNKIYGGSSWQPPDSYESRDSD